MAPAGDDLLPVAQARARILAAMQPLAPELVGLERALGRVLAEPVAARRDQPPLAVSAMDG
jgi:molybdopterin molybdotransferase